MTELPPLGGPPSGASRPPHLQRPLRTEHCCQGHPVCPFELSQRASHGHSGYSPSAQTALRGLWGPVSFMPPRKERPLSFEHQTAALTVPIHGTKRPGKSGTVSATKLVMTAMDRSTAGNALFILTLKRAHAHAHTPPWLKFNFPQYSSLFCVMHGDTSCSVSSSVLAANSRDCLLGPPMAHSLYQRLLLEGPGPPRGIRHGTFQCTPGYSY